VSNLDQIRSYYEALNTGDVGLIASHFTDDAVHYYTRLGPHRGREIAENAKWGVETIDGQWHLEHGTYHHGDRKNPQGDLLGFDHEGRGHTTMEDWQPPERRTAT
jgi:ketosteroid isomerase-like protein